ncbi:MAG: serine--tRNA ligase [Candidatus Latescibacterota bacterium]|nr:serine--tRNA ligase [Candidatus Latescibacterota bacterium]
MIDARMARGNIEELRKSIEHRKVDLSKADVDRWVELDEDRRKLQGKIDYINVEKKELAKLGKENPEAARNKGKELRERSRELERELDLVSKEWQQIFDWFPNWPDAGMPIGHGEEDNVEEKVWIPGDGYFARDRLGVGDHSVQYMPSNPIHSVGKVDAIHHSDLGLDLGSIDTLQASKVSGSRFAYLRGDVAKMQYAISRLLIDELFRRDYEMFIPPLLVRERALYGTSHFPEGRDQVYAISSENVEEGNQLFLVGSSEPTNFSYFADKSFSADQLPQKLFAYTPCFRSEAGSWGKDVKGIKRVHQFDKIEMNTVCLPNQSETLYQEFAEINEWLLQQLELPYRIVDKCTGDAGYLASFRQKDLEVWLSGSCEYMEVMTDTNTTDYQARRLGIRYRTETDRGFCHTVNDTGAAMGRLLIAILDNYQQNDGTILIPKVLQEGIGKTHLVLKN